MDPSDDGDDSNIVEAEIDVLAESTVPEAAPLRRSTPVSVPAPRPERQRRLTVASPIPAQLAASMRGDGGAGPAASSPWPPRRDGVPVRAGSAQTTSRLTEEKQAALLNDGEPEYVVEIDASKPGG